MAHESNPETAVRLWVDGESPKQALAEALWAVRRAMGKCRDFDFEEGVTAMVAARDLIDETRRQWAEKSCFVCAGAGTTLRPCPECGYKTPTEPSEADRLRAALARCVVAMRQPQVADYEPARENAQRLLRVDDNTNPLC